MEVTNKRGKEGKGFYREKIVACFSVTPGGSSQYKLIKPILDELPF